MGVVWALAGTTHRSRVQARACALRHQFTLQSRTSRQYSSKATAKFSCSQATRPPRCHVYHPPPPTTNNGSTGAGGMSADTDLTTTGLLFSSEQEEFMRSLITQSASSSIPNGHTSSSPLPPPGRVGELT